MHSERVPQPFYRSLYFQVLIAIAIGVLLGHFAPESAVKLRPLGDGFIKLVKMMIGPIIFCTVVSGIAGMENLKSVGKTGVLALLYFEVVSTIALVLGLVIVNLVKPGVGMNIDVSTLDGSAVAGYSHAAEAQGVIPFLLNIIPTTFFDAFAAGEILQILLIALLFGFALHAVGEPARIVHEFIERISQVLFRIIAMIMYLAPLGALGAMAFTIGAYGIGKLMDLAWLMICFYATCLLFIFVILGTIARAHGFSIWKFVKYIREELFIVLGTSSSESVLPRMMTRLERAGCARSVVGLVIPTGYSFNLDGTSIYLTMAAVFIAQATNTPLTVVDQLTLLAILLVTSK
ncbi:MAG TPA: C4-dicarboxylate transporter DctA, partial [Povalibacter sp.]